MGLGYGAGGQVSWAGDNSMYSSGPHVGGPPGGSGVYTATYTKYKGEVHTHPYGDGSILGRE